MLAGALAGKGGLAAIAEDCTTLRSGVPRRRQRLAAAVVDTAPREVIVIEEKL